MVLSKCSSGRHPCVPLSPYVVAGLAPVLHILPRRAWAVRDAPQGMLLLQLLLLLLLLGIGDVHSRSWECVPHM
jgi:hypothetical protein